MPTSLQNPLLPTHYFVWFDPPDEAGDEVLHFVSERQSLKLKGRAFREFHQRVIPMLDGKHSIAEIETATADIFPAAELRDALGLLADQGIVVDAAAQSVSAEVAERMAPQLNLFHDLAPGLPLQKSLENATVAVLGLSGAGARVVMTSSGMTGRCPSSISPPPIGQRIPSGPWKRMWYGLRCRGRSGAGRGRPGPPTPCGSRPTAAVPRSRRDPASPRRPPLPRGRRTAGG